MFEIRRYKKNARIQLKNRRLLSALVTAICALCLLAFFPMQSHLSGALGISSALFIAVAGIMANALSKLFLRFVKSLEPASATLNTYLEGLEDWFRGILAAVIVFFRSALWATLFVVPGIVALYKYSLAFYLLAENRKMPPSRAVRISAIMTRGYKADLFMLHLSFLPLIALSVLTAGIGFLWTLPYIAVATGNAYLEIKNAALKRHILEAEDF